MIVVDVASASELQDRGARAIDDARAGGDLEIELRLAPGVYEDAAIGLGGTGPIVPALTLRAADGANPPRLTDLSMRLRASRVRVEGLVFGPTRRSMPIVALEGHRVEIARCAVIGCRLDSQPGGCLVQLTACGGEPGSAVLEDCWLVEDHATGDGCALIGLDGYPQGFSLVECRGTAFVANHARVTILQRAEALRLTGCIAVAAPDAAPADVFVGLTAPDALAEFADCLVAWPDVASIVGGTAAAADGGPEGVTYIASAGVGRPALERAIERAARGERPTVEGLASELGLGSPASPA